MKIFSWNVNGIRAVQKKGFLDFINKYDPDILCLQETKAELAQLDDKLINISGYTSYFESCKIKKGYSGVAIYSKENPINQSCSLESDEAFDVEGRNQIFEFEKFTLLNFYFPNGQMSDERLDYKLKFHDGVYSLLMKLKKKKKPIIVCGDYNIAHSEIDLKHPKPNQNTSGFLRIERDWLDKLEKAKFIDTFRYFHPSEVKYSWWTYMRNARQNNVGWRIDYFWTNKISIVKKAEIHNEVFGSDHCPVSITLKP
jgi:exodeoxyribonuclease-3